MSPLHNTNACCYMERLWLLWRPDGWIPISRCRRCFRPKADDGIVGFCQRCLDTGLVGRLATVAEWIDEANQYNGPDAEAVLALFRRRFPSLPRARTDDWPPAAFVHELDDLPIMQLNRAMYWMDTDSSIRERVEEAMRTLNNDNEPASAPRSRSPPLARLSIRELVEVAMQQLNNDNEPASAPRARSPPLARLGGLPWRPRRDIAADLTDEGGWRTPATTVRVTRTLEDDMACCQCGYRRAWPCQHPLCPEGRGHVWPITMAHWACAWCGHRGDDGQWQCPFCWD